MCRQQKTLRRSVQIVRYLIAIIGLYKSPLLYIPNHRITFGSFFLETIILR